MADKLAEERRDLPWVPIEKDYRFDTEDGTRTLAELFDGRSQLLVYHFMFGPSYEAGCPVCSSSADAVNGVLPHLRARDVTMLYVSRAPLEAARIQAKDGVEVPLGLLRGQRLQLRLQRLPDGGATPRAHGADARGATTDCPPDGDGGGHRCCRILVQRGGLAPSRWMAAPSSTYSTYARGLGP